jgi:hypothetical protein
MQGCSGPGKARLGLSLLETVEDFKLQAVVSELCSEIAASLHASAMLLPCELYLDLAQLRNNLL